MELTSNQEKLYGLAKDKGENGFCIHEIEDNLKIPQPIAYHIINDLLTKKLIIKQKIKFECKWCQQKHIFWGISKDVMEAEKKNAVIAKESSKEITDLKKENVELKRTLGNQKHWTNEYKKKCERLEAGDTTKVKELEKMILDKNEAINFADREMEKFKDMIHSLRNKNAVLKELLKEELLRK